MRMLVVEEVNELETMKHTMDAFPDFRNKLYIRGFLLTNSDIDDSIYPFYGAWNRSEIANVTLLTHPQQKAYAYSMDDISVAIVGHAFNPCTEEPLENNILCVCLQKLKESDSAFWNYFNQLTGVFTFLVFRGDEVWIIDDASGMQTTFYTAKNGKLFVSSHTNLLGELLGLEKDPYVERLVKYRFFPLLGNSLPGDLTQFVGLKRVTPNYCCVYRDGAFSNKRFFAPYQMKDKSRQQLVDEAGQILHNTLEMIAKKWEKPAISLTGGCDSKTTLACANGLYDKFRYYSYCSSEAEKVDCDAAAEICKALGAEHKVYTVLETLSESDHQDIVARILRWNCGDLLDCNANDVRKRITLDKIDDYDVEVKSWASEIGRAYYSKRFHGRTKFPKEPSGRACTTLYKFFLHERRLVLETDKVFEQFIRDYYEPAEENPIEWFEQFFWEFRVPSWNGLVITGEHWYSDEITIPYNNRVLLTMLLSVPIEDRVADTLYEEIRAARNPIIDETGISVTNLLHTERREQFENLYWTLHSKVPF